MRPRPTLRVSQALLDTSAYFALTDARDANHAAARAISTRLIAEHWRLFTTNFSLAETHALLLTRLGRSVALRVLRETDRSTITIVRVSAADEHRARKVLVQYGDKDCSLTDATSFTVMDRLGIRHAFTFDRHFGQYGWKVLTPDQP